MLICCQLYDILGLEVMEMRRKAVNTTLDEDLYKKIKVLAIKLDKNANDLIEEGMEYIIDKYENQKNV